MWFGFGGLWSPKSNHSHKIYLGVEKMQDLVDRLKNNAAKIHDLLEHL
jgi:hypothetical protein